MVITPALQRARPRELPSGRSLDLSSVVWRMQSPITPSLRDERLGIVAFFACAALALSRGAAPDAGDRSTALAAALGERGVTVAVGDVVWVDPPRGPFGLLGFSARAVARGAAAGEPTDLYLADTELSPEGVLLSVSGVHNLTETSGAEESKPVLRGSTLAYVSRPLIEAASSTVHVLHLDGQPDPSALDWSALERLQVAVTNWQATGRVRGIGRRTLAIDAPAAEENAADAAAGEGKHAAPPVDDVAVAIEDGAIIVRSGGRAARVDGGNAEENAEDNPGAPLPPWIRAETSEVARPGNVVTWAVDRVRLVIGDDAMQTVKAVAFTALEFVLRNKEAVTGDTGAEDIAADLGKSELGPAVRQIPIDPEIGWPPAPLDVWVTPALPGEGQWNPQGGDAFVRKLDGLPPAFMTTFIRSDRSRKATRVYIALWDPRQVELHMMAGTVEPKGATGEAGPGLIPRTPEVMKRVVAASNAGFQAMHGEFGMMADGVVYLPPKPYGATVAVKRDGSTVFGTWSQDERIPDWMLSYRQNMTVMVEDEKFNPFGRTWWGGTPPGWADKTHTVRTGICLTKEHFVAYFYGSDISPDALAQGMIQARCAYGIALDMNAGHSGLEFYHVDPTDELPQLERPLQYDWETEGDVSGLSGWHFRARRLIRGMGLMNFPRYIRREARDFFYMTLRQVLPGAALTPRVKPAEQGEGVWRVKALPQHGFPYAIAVTEVRPDPARPDVRLRVLKVDPRTVSAAPVASGQTPASGTSAVGATVVVLGEGSTPPGAPGSLTSLWHSAGAFSIAAAAPVHGAVRLATGQAATSGAVAAVGVNDEDGMLIYAELVAGAPTPSSAAPTPAHSAAEAPAGVLSDPRNTKQLQDFLSGLGCSSRLLLPHPLAVALGGDTDLSGAAVHPPSGPNAVRLARAEAPGAGRIFEATPVAPFNVWYPLQQKRIRYFKKPKGEEAAGEAH